MPVTLLFGSAPKIVLFALLLKISCFNLQDIGFVWSLIIGFSAVLSIAIGSVSAILQKRLKRLLAYSTIAHTGFILLAFLASSLDASKALIFYLVVYSSLTVTVFSLLIYAAVSTAKVPAYLVNYSGIGMDNHVFSASLGLTILAVGGIPPLAGFFSKLFILISLIGVDHFFVALIILFFSSISCYYYIRLVKIVFFVKNEKGNMWLTSSSKQSTELVVGFYLLFVICYFIRPDLIMNFSVINGFVLF